MVLIISPIPRLAMTLVDFMRFVFFPFLVVLSNMEYSCLQTVTTTKIQNVHLSQPPAIYLPESIN